MKCRLCCIEPSAALRAVVTALAEGKGWTVAAYADLPEAEAMLAREGSDLVTIATVLPSAECEQIVRHLRSLPNCETVPIVMLTGEADAALAATALELGVTEVFQKNDLDSFQIYLETFARQHADEALAGGRGLVLEDDRALAHYVAAVLSGLGLQVDVFASADEALGATLLTAYDLIVADLVLGEAQSGNAFIRLVRQSAGKSADAPIIAISGFGDHARRIEALRAGASSYLAKPITEAELCLHVRKLLAPGEVAVPPAATTAEEMAAWPGLSERERTISRLAVAGYADKDIARQLNISYWTVRTHMSRIFRKCDVGNRVELANKLRSPGSKGGRKAPSGSDDAQRAVIDWLSLTAHVVDSLQQGLVVTDANQVILQVNPAFTRITGFSSDEAVGRTPRILRSGKQDAGFYAAIFERLAESGTWSGELWNRHKDGRLYLEWLEIRELPPGLPGGARYVGVISDITAHRLEEEGVRYSALHDVLTGLGNRVLLSDRAEQEIARARRYGTRLGVVFIDLDRFKPINDSLGHEAGDRVLKDIARRLRAEFRANDTLARYGGDEFVALVPDIVSRDDALAAATKVLAALRDPFTLNGLDYRVGASVGASIYPEDGSDFDELIAHADMAMYRAKEAGGNLIKFYDDKMNQAAGEQLRLESRLHKGLDNGEFELLFQPKIEISGRRIVGAEALLRWHDPERGTLLPDDFIPLTEKTGLIVPLGNWVLREACRALKRIRAAGFEDFTMAINVSPLQIVRQDLAAELKDALAQTGVPADRLQLEITESAFIRDPIHVAELLNELVKTGVSLALDDFGTGYSSLGYLKHLPIDTIKVDRQFIDQVHADRYNGSIARATIHLANGLELKVVAEGVENGAQLAYLQGIGCDYAQGYIFAQPMTEAELLQLLAPAARG